MSSVEASLRPVVRRVRMHLRGVGRLLRLQDPIASVRNGPADARISTDQLEQLREAWGNPGYEADLDYLERVCDHAMSTTRPVLECGSGLTTVLLSLAVASRGVPVWSLEHDRAWYRATRWVLSYFGFRGVQLCHVPLVDHGPFAWYDAPLSVMPARFGLVVCDGPPGSTPGGRGGVIPVMGRRLDGATILVDDAERPPERAMLADWVHSYRASVDMVTTGAGSRVATVTLPDAPASDDRAKRQRWRGFRSE